MRETALWFLDFLWKYSLFSFFAGILFLPNLSMSLGQLCPEVQTPQKCKIIHWQLRTAVDAKVVLPIGRQSCQSLMWRFSLCQPCLCACQYPKMLKKKPTLEIVCYGWFRETAALCFMRLQRHLNLPVGHNIDSHQNHHPILQKVWANREIHKVPLVSSSSRRKADTATTINGVRDTAFAKVV